MKKMCRSLLKYYYEVEKYNKLIIDISSKDQLPKISNLSDLSNHQFQDLYIAIVYSEEDDFPLTSIKRIVEFCSSFHVSEIKLFTNNLEAVEWLCKVS